MKRKITRRAFVKSGACAALAGAGAVLWCRHGGFCAQAFAGTTPPTNLRVAGGRKPAMEPSREPPYLELHRSGELRRRADHLWSLLKSCEICPRRCRVNRLEGVSGFCRASSDLIISSHHPHFGEERPLVGRGGSGTVFFSHCSLRCVFCINWETSHEGIGARQPRISPP